MRSIVDRLSDKLELVDSGCWIFNGSILPNGYGKIRYLDRIEYVHRVSWILHIGPIPKDMVVRHLCDVRLCCNPEHLALGTYRDNAQDRRRGAIANLFPVYHY